MRLPCLALLIALIGCAKPLDRKRLHGVIRDLRAVAAETQLLLARAQREAWPTGFVDGQREYLAERGRKAQDHLADGVEDSGLEADRRVALELGARLLPLVELAGDSHAFDALIPELTRVETRVAP
jgi:hypothetical protein